MSLWVDGWTVTSETSRSLFEPFGPGDKDGGRLRRTLSCHLRPPRI